MSRLSILILILIPFHMGCPKSNECGRNFYLSGRVTDQSGVPLENVEVREVTHFGFDSVETTTNASGDYSSFLGTYSDLGNGYIYFRKSGYRDTATSSIGKGDGSCGDQQVVRDGIMIAE